VSGATERRGALQESCRGGQDYFVYAALGVFLVILQSMADPAQSNIDTSVAFKAILQATPRGREQYPVCSSRKASHYDIYPREA
jgi:hypothetical protein